MTQLAGDAVEPVMVVPRPFVKAEKGYYLSDRPDDYPGPSALVPDDVMTEMLAG